MKCKECGHECGEAQEEKAEASAKKKGKRPFPVKKKEKK